MYWIDSEMKINPVSLEQLYMYVWYYYIHVCCMRCTFLWLCSNIFYWVNSLLSTCLFTYFWFLIFLFSSHTHTHLAIVCAMVFITKFTLKIMKKKIGLKLHTILMIYCTVYKMHSKRAIVGVEKLFIYICNLIFVIILWQWKSNAALFFQNSRKQVYILSAYIEIWSLHHIGNTININISWIEKK